MPLPILPLLSPQVREFKRLVRLGNAARDARRWPEAVRHYTAALGLEAKSPGVWVQLGHAHKESGRFAEAEAAYFRADRLRPDDADLHVQLGHLCKLRGNAAAAAEYYRRARELGSTDPAAGGAAPAAAPGPAARAALPAATTTTVFLDISDLVLHFRNNRFPTGIQRVQIELFRASLDWRGEADIRTVVFSHNPQFWTDIDPVAFSRLCDLASSPGSKDDPDWQSASREFIHRLEAQPATRMPRDSILVNIGTSWWMPNYMQVVREAKSRLGLCYVPMVFDLVPMIVPEFLDGNLGPVFCSWISSVFLHADATAVISHNTGRDLAAAAATVRSLRQPPVVMPLDAQSPPPNEPAPAPAGRARILENFGVSEGKYVLFVGTFEARKNHLMVFQAWKQLLQQHGRERMPTLLCVGKRGWRFETTAHFLNSHPELADRVKLVSGVSDAELRSLFLGCRFTLYNSVYEGWGLPVTESLGFGKACLTPGHSSLPEAGGDLADYYNSDSLPDLVAHAERLILDDAYLRARETRIAAEHRPRSWTETLEGLLRGVLAQVGPPPAADTFCAPVAWNTPYELVLRHDLHGVDPVGAVAEMLRAGNSWHEIDGWGVWAKQQIASLAFLVPELGDSTADADRGAQRLGGTVLRALELRAGEARLVHVPLAHATLDAHRRERRPLALRLHADRLAPAAVHGEQKLAGLGLSLFALCRTDDVGGRLGLLEHAVLTTLVVRTD